MTLWPSGHNTHLFTLQVWLEELGQGQSEWRGRLTYLPTGEVRYFRDIATLHRALLAILESSQAPE